MKITILASFTFASLCLCAAANVTETFTIGGDQAVWSGTSDLTWSQSFSGNSLEVAGGQLQTGVADTGELVLLTDATTGGALGNQASWSVDITTIGGSMAVNGNGWGGLILSSSSTTASDIIAGSMTGWRAVVTSGDIITLQEASGAGWVDRGTTGAFSSWGDGVVNTMSATVDLTTGEFTYSIGGASGSFTAGPIATWDNNTGIFFNENRDNRGIAIDNFSVASVAGNGPSSVNDNYSMDQDTVYTNAAPGVLSNDTDGSGDPLTAIQVTSPANGSLLDFSTNGSFIYQPTPGYTGTDSFTYQATDGVLTGNTATVFIQVNDTTPYPPVSTDDSYASEVNTILNIAAPGVLDNDSDSNGDSMTAVLVSSPTNGTLLAFPTDGSFSYEPATGFSGIDTFTYAATDGTLTGNVATVSITVTVTSNPLQLPQVFQDNMVFQRNEPIPVWGWGPVGETVTVSLSSGQTDNTVIDANGRWETTLPAMPATSGPLTLTVSVPGTTLTRTNIAVGDLWFMSGQSNAGWSLSATDDSDAEIASANYPDYRLIRLPRLKLDAPSDDPLNMEDSLDWDTETGALKEKAGTWFVCNPENAPRFGAVFYYAGKKIHLEEGIPVGILQSAYAGTPVEAWTTTPVPEEHLPGSDPADPRQLYNGMVYPYQRFPVTGFCWYQGERNHDDGGFIYADKLSIMINDWRTLWGRNDIPFYYLQIPPVFEWDTEIDANPTLPHFWEAQTAVQEIISNSYMVCISDTTTGQLHPKNKKPAGERLGNRILKHSYGAGSIQDVGPTFSHAVTEGSSMRCYFTEIGGGLMINPNIGFNADGDYAVDYYEDDNHNGILDTKEDRDKDGVLDIWGEDLNHNGVMDPGEDIDGDGILDLSEWEINFTHLTWFEVCGADGIFTNANAVIDGNTVVVSAPSIPNPVGVRYGWDRFAQGNLMNAEGLPAPMFRQTPLFARDESYTTYKNQTLYIIPAGILENDEQTGPLQPIQKPIVISSPTNGQLTVKEDGAFIYTPNHDFIGTDTFTYTATDGVETSAVTTVSLNVLSENVGSGTVTRELWFGIPGATVNDLLSDPRYPDSPDESGTLTSLDAPRGADGNGYGQRIHGYLHPPADGSYTFWITSAARSKLYLSTDDDPANAVEICECNVTLSGEYENWTNNAAQMSASVPLLAAQKYYIQILHNEGNDDHCSVAWNLGGTTNIVDGAYLSPIPTPNPTANYAGWSSWYGVSGDSYLLDFAFNHDPTQGEIPDMIPVSGTEGLPYWEVSTIDGLQVEYLRRKNAPGLTYSVQFSDNLQSNWVDHIAAESVIPVNDVWDRVTVEDAVDTAAATSRFGRVTVMQD